MLVSGPSAVVHIVPTASLDGPDLDPRVLKNHRRLLRLEDGATEGASGRQWWAHGPTCRIGDRPNPEGHWYGRLLQPGVIEFEQTIGERIDDDPTILIRGTGLEAEIVNMADQGIALAEGLGCQVHSALASCSMGLRTSSSPAATAQGGSEYPALICHLACLLKVSHRQEPACGAPSISSGCPPDSRMGHRPTAGQLGRGMTLRQLPSSGTSIYVHAPVAVTTSRRPPPAHAQCGGTCAHR
jgi:hypothetical protein